MDVCDDGGVGVQKGQFHTFNEQKWTILLAWKWSRFAIPGHGLIVFPANNNNNDGNVNARNGNPMTGVGEKGCEGCRSWVCLRSTDCVVVDWMLDWIKDIANSSRWIVLLWELQCFITALEFCYHLSCMMTALPLFILLHPLTLTSFD